MASAAPDESALAQLYQKYGRNRSAGVGVAELGRLLRDLGLLEGKPAAETPGYVVAQFAAADKDRDSALDFQEFTDYYLTVTAPKLADQLQAEAPEGAVALRRTWEAFAAFGAGSAAPQQHGATAAEPEMDGARFLKLCRETGLLRAGLTSTDADLCFAKAKARGARKIDFERFVDALGLLAGRTRGRQSARELVALVVASPGPAVNSGGAAASSGRNHPMEPLDGGCTPTAAGAARHARRASWAAAPAGAATPPPPAGLTRQLQTVFLRFAAFGHSGQAAGPAPELGSAQFAKLCRESGLGRGGASLTDIDLAFARARREGTRKLTFPDFLRALEELSARQGMQGVDVLAGVAACTGPRLNATTPDPVRLHDDTSTYTGVYAERARSVSVDENSWQAAGRKAAQQRAAGLSASDRQNSLTGGSDARS